MYNCLISKRFNLLSLTWVVGLLFTTIGFAAQWQMLESSVEINNLQPKEPVRSFTIMRDIIGYVKHGLKRTASRLLRAVESCHGTSNANVDPQSKRIFIGIHPTYT